MGVHRGTQTADSANSATLQKNVLSQLIIESIPQKSWASREDYSLTLPGVRCVGPKGARFVHQSRQTKFLAFICEKPPGVSVIVVYELIGYDTLLQIYGFDFTFRVIWFSSYWLGMIKIQILSYYWRDRIEFCFFLRIQFSFFMLRNWWKFRISWETAGVLWSMIDVTDFVKVARVFWLSLIKLKVWGYELNYNLPTTQASVEPAGFSFWVDNRQIGPKCRPTW